MPSKKLSYLVIGCGSIGRRHIYNLLGLGRTVFAYDSDSLTLKSVKKEFTGVTFYSKLSQVWKASPDIAMICTPTSKHMALAIQAVKQGCHLFIEKPISHNLARTQELIKLLERNNLVSLVGCNMRFQYGIKRVKSLSGILGKISSIRCEFGQYLPDWRPNQDYSKSYSAHKKMGGGIALDAIHELDYLLYIMAKKPVGISALMANSGLLKIDVEDNAEILLKFSDRSLGEVHLDYLNRRYHRGCQIVAERGSVYWNETERTIKVYTVRDGRWKIEKEPENSNFNQSYIEEVLHLEACIRQKKETANSVSAAVRTLRIALAAKQSANTGKHIKIDRLK